MQLSKNKKIILSTIGVGVLLASIITPILILNNKEEDKNQKEKIEPNKGISTNEIKSKIKNKDLIIPKNVKTFSDSEIFLAIKNQLKTNNSTLTDDDLSKITDNIWHLKPGKKTSVTLTIKSNDITDSIKVNVTKEKNIKLWTKNSAIVKSSNIKNGSLATNLIQDSFGNIWSMGNGSSLQVLERDGTKWNNNVSIGLTKGSKILDGTNGKIFEDDFGNLWAMGLNSKLQVLKNENGNFVDSWTSDNSDPLLRNSLILEGFGGRIFQDSFGNLWAMGYGASLQVLVKNKEDGTYKGWWNEEKSLLKNSNVNNWPNVTYTGKYGTIFQDSFGNLWTMGKNSKLQVLKVDPSSSTGYVNSGWINDNDKKSGDKLLKNSYIVAGEYGTIFQDSFGNLWASGGGYNLQVLKAKLDGSGYVDSGWTIDNSQGLLKNSNINVIGLREGISKGNAVERIFQDSFGNLWIQGKEKDPQVLKAKVDGTGYVDSGWTDNNDPTSGDKLLKNLKTFLTQHTLKIGWVFFQDSSKNLWAMGNGTKLQFLKAKPDGTGYLNNGWTDDTNNELLKTSNIISGYFGQIFEDSYKNLWTMGYNPRRRGIDRRRPNLQVYHKTLKTWIS